MSTLAVGIERDGRGCGRAAIRTGADGFTFGDRGPQTWVVVPVLAAIACALGCGGDTLLSQSRFPDTETTQSPSQSPPSRPASGGISTAPPASSDGALRVEFEAEPQVTHENGRTSIVVDLVVRAGDGTPLADRDLDVTLLQAPASRELASDDVLDAESQLSTSETDARSNLNFQLVLDASFSMTQHDPPAFEPMKTAAADAIEQVRDLWESRGGTVATGLLWFDEWIYHAEGEWDRSQIERGVQVPVVGTPTRLLGAVHYMASHMRAEYSKGVASGPRDRHVMLVFTDGKDNVSTLDSTGLGTSSCRGFCGDETKAECQDGTLTPPCPNPIGADLCSATGDASTAFHSRGYSCVDLAAVEEVFASHPNLVVHVVGLGSDVSRSELLAIADAGGGTAVFGADSGAIRELFNDVLKEFVNIQTYGASIPQPRGEYRFGILVTAGGGLDASVGTSDSAEALCTFEYSTEEGFVMGSVEGEGCVLL